MIPKVSIITINLNNVNGLQKTIESIIAQTSNDYECIVIDGGSTDGSQEIIEKFSNRLGYWDSEKDKGIFHAMNKGSGQAKGEYCLFLNSGDYFVDDGSLYKLLDNGDRKDLIYGNIVVDNVSQQWIKRYPPSLTFNYFLKDTLPHPATLIRRELLCNNPYNEQNKITSDWEFFIYAVCILNVSYKYVNTEVSVFNLEGLSSDRSNDDLIKKEKNVALHKYFSAFLEDYEEMDELRKRLMTNPLWYYSKKLFK